MVWVRIRLELGLKLVLELGHIDVHDNKNFHI